MSAPIEIPKALICINCGDKFCCRGLCKEMNNYLINKKKEGKQNEN